MLVVADAGGEIRRGVCGTSAGSIDTWRTTEGRGHSHILWIYKICVTYWCISNAEVFRGYHGGSPTAVQA